MIRPSRHPSRKPLDRDLYADVVAEAKQRFDVWPSAYASGWVVKTYKARGGRYAGAGRASGTGLTKWFGESWVDLSRPIHDEDGELVGYEPCGRKASDDPAAYPKCRPLAEAMRMSPSEVKDAIKRKRAAEAKAARGGRGGRGARAPVRVSTYRANPALEPEAIISGDEAAAIERDNDSRGKQRGHNRAAAHEQVRSKGDHVLVRVPVGPDYLHADSDEPGYEDVGEKRTQEYAQLATEPPPIYITFGERSQRRGGTRAYVVNGNHRVRAARMQGRPTLLAMMPVADFQRWRSTLSTRANPIRPSDDISRWAAKTKRFDLDRCVNPYDPEDDPLSDVYVIATDELEDGTLVKYIAVPFPYERKPLGYRDDPKVQGLVNLATLIGTQRRVSVAGVEKYLAGVDEKPPRPGSSRMPAILVYETSDGRQYIADGHHRAVAALIRGFDAVPAIIQLVRE